MTILSTVLDWFLPYIFALYIVGWDDDTSHSQVRCPSEDSESILCSNLPGGMYSKFK